MKHNFKKLDVWHRSRKLTVGIYTLTRYFPKSEQNGLSNQIRRAAVSVISNIAEGSGRDSPKEFAQYLNIAIGSLCEIEAQLYLALDLEYIQTIHTKEVITELNEIRRIIYSLRKRVLRNI
ncbi:MAG: four helix bundle protein [Calditrichota bacterium]